MYGRGVVERGEVVVADDWFIVEKMLGSFYAAMVYAAGGFDDDAQAGRGGRSGDCVSNALDRTTDHTT